MCIVHTLDPRHFLQSVSNLTHEIRTKNALYRGHSASYGLCAAGPVGVKCFV